MSDLIFKTKGKETFRIPFPTPGTKCPEMKLEIKMTETDISKVLIEGDYATIMGVKYKRVEEPKSLVEEAYKDWCGEYRDFVLDCYHSTGSDELESIEDFENGVFQEYYYYCHNTNTGFVFYNEDR